VGRRYPTTFQFPRREHSQLWRENVSYYSIFFALKLNGVSTRQSSWRGRCGEV